MVLSEICQLFVVSVAFVYAEYTMWIPFMVIVIKIDSNPSPYTFTYFNVSGSTCILVCSM